MKKAKKLLLLLAVVVTAMVCLSISAFAATGQCGENVYWEYNSKTKELVISGEGYMKDYEIDFDLGEVYSDSPFYDSAIRTVVIKNGVKNIGDGAFSYCTNLTSVIIPDSVTSIGEGAFGSCTSLTSITIPDSVTSIGEGAFCYCESLTSITIPDSVTSIGDDTFYNCKSLTSITIPDSVTSIGSSTFYNCTSLTSITIPDSVTSIGGSAFYNCTSLTSITIPDGVTTIGEEAFSCSGLKSITIPDSVTSIGSKAFYDCRSLAEIEFPGGVSVIVKDAFWNCKRLKRIIIGEGVTTITGNAFNGCTSLSSIVLPVSLKTIEDAAFDGCYSIRNVYYNGTEEEWENINIGVDNNYMTNAVIHYSYTCEHNNKSEYPRQNATCAQVGYTAGVYCPDCKTWLEGHEETEALPHSYSSEITTQPTHIKKGVKTYTCTVCGDTYKEAVAKTKGHTYESVLTAPTCTAKGFTTYTCECGDSYIADYEAILAHTYSSTVSRPASHHTVGIKTYVCRTCGDSYSEPIAKLTAHTYEKVIKNPTCTSDGYIKYICACDDSYKEELPAKGHTNKTTTTKATLTKNGKTETKCTVCGKTSKTTIYYPKSISLSVTDYTYDGKVKAPSVTVKDSKGNTLKKNTDYTVKYAGGRKAPGKYAVTVTFKGKYSGEKILTFTVKPATPTLKVTSTSKGKATLAWTNVSGESGYQIYYSTKKDSGFKLYGTAKANTTKATVKVTSGKTYYFRVRAFVKTDSGTVYGSYKTVAVKVK